LFLIGQFLKKSSPLKPLDQMSRNLVGGSFGQVVSEENIFLELNHFRGEYFLELNQSEIRIVCGGHVC
jgi:hypothetical protein